MPACLPSTSLCLLWNWTSNFIIFSIQVNEEIQKNVEFENFNNCAVSKKILFQYCLSTFKEMINAGITTVGEFHYVHHSEQKLVLQTLFSWL